MVLTEIHEGVELFNDGEFFAAHDFFEELWQDCRNEKKLLYQGLVQVSVGSYHFVCGNFRGAKNQYIKGTEKLIKYVDIVEKIDLNVLLREIKKLIIQIENDPGIKNNFNPLQIPKIQYKK